MKQRIRVRDRPAGGRACVANKAAAGARPVYAEATPAKRMARTLIGAYLGRLGLTYSMVENGALAVEAALASPSNMT